MNLNRAIQLALADYKAGNLVQAKHQSMKILKVDPDNVDILNLMGVMHFELKNYDSAVKYFEKVIHLKPHFPDALFNLGNAYREKGELDKAAFYYEKTLRLQPNYAGAYNNLGIIYQNKSEFDKAIYYYQKAIGIDYCFADAYYNLGNAYREKKHLDEAIIYYQKALQLRPKMHGAYNNLGSVFLEKQQWDKAIACYEQALKLDPENVMVFVNLGGIFQTLGKYDEAILYYKKALDINPDSAIPYNNLGSVFKEKGLPDKAEYYFSKAVKLDPYNLVFSENLLFQMLYNARCGVHDIFMEHLRFAEHYEKPLFSSIVTHINDRIPSRKLKIGYLSPDFRRHSVAYFIEPVLLAHSHEEFEICCYSDVLVPDDVTRRIQGFVDQWKNIAGISNADIVDLIRKDEIDILIDLAGHTVSNRMLVFARKPAPIQVTWIGYPATTGFSTMDYKIVDGYTDPPGKTEQFYTEKLIRLPESFLCYQPDRESPGINDLPALTAGYITFGSFNNFAKVSQECLKLWVKILKAIPGSRLVIKGKALADKSTSRYAMNMFTGEGIPEARIELLGWKTGVREHLEAYNRIDIGLDTFPYNGTTTTCEAMWMGVPVITLAGTAYASRAGVSLLSNIGYSELIAYSADEYVALAAGLANDLNRLQRIRRNLRKEMAQSLLCNAGRFIVNLEHCYREIWKSWCNSA